MRLIPVTVTEDEEESGLFCITGCGEQVPIRRARVGTRTCNRCGERIAKQVKHAIVPVPKSNYVYAHSINDVISPYSHKGNR